MGGRELAGLIRRDFVDARRITIAGGKTRRPT
jgi:hypothetical protein